MEWSNGVIRLMATLRWDGRCIAELYRKCEARRSCVVSYMYSADGCIVRVPDDAVCTFTDDVEDLVVFADDEARQTFVHDGRGVGTSGMESGGMCRDSVAESCQCQIGLERFRDILLLL